MIPLIPILALAGFAVSVGTLVWYYNLSQQEQETADRKAIAWFGKRFADLAEYQQKQIQEELRKRKQT